MEFTIVKAATVEIFGIVEIFGLLYFEFLNDVMSQLLKSGVMDK